MVFFISLKISHPGCVFCQELWIYYLSAKISTAIWIKQIICVIYFFYSQKTGNVTTFFVMSEDRHSELDCSSLIQLIPTEHPHNCPRAHVSLDFTEVLTCPFQITTLFFKFHSFSPHLYSEGLYYWIVINLSKHIN